MGLDASTLRDLEVLSASVPRGPTILDLVDRTRSRAGRDALRRQLASPSGSAEEILARQRAHRALAADSDRCRDLFQRIGCDGVERYLSSNWQLPGTRSATMRLLDGVWRPKWFREYLADVENGQLLVESMIRAAADLARLLAASDAKLLRDGGEALATQLSAAPIQNALSLAARRSMAARLQFDQIARDRGKALLNGILAVVAAVEAMWSLGIATREHRWCYPQPAAQFAATGLYHPFVGAEAVPNDIRLDPAVRVCFVTGPNMAGKSTFLKALAIAMLLAQTGCGVPAHAMEFRPVQTVFSSVQVMENLSAHESFYLAEVRRIRSLAAALHSHESVFAVLDEPFRGTNVHDAGEATIAVISRLVDHPGALVFVASHLAEIAPDLVRDARVALLQFRAELTAERLVFDYRVRDGVSTQRLGMTLLEQEGVLGLLDRKE
jgi:DNA mismatch repair protein MutS